MDEVLPLGRINRIKDIDLTAIELWLHNQEKSGAFGAKTRNYYAKAMKQFCAWLVRRKRTNTNPVAELEMVNAQVDVRYQRRVLTTEQSERLIAAAIKGEIYRVRPTSEHGLTGTDRAVLYQLALTTGLRAQECASLTTNSFDLGDTPTIFVEAGYAKNKERAILPLRADVADLLRQWIGDRQGKLFPGRW